MIIRNAVQCKVCNKVVESKSHYDWQKCDCPDTVGKDGYSHFVYTDGGLDYIHRGGDRNQYIELDVFDPPEKKEEVSKEIVFTAIKKEEQNDDMKWVVNLLNNNKGKLFDQKYNRFEINERTRNTDIACEYQWNGHDQEDFCSLDSIELWSEICKAFFKDMNDTELLGYANEAKTMMALRPLEYSKSWQYHLGQIVLLPENQRVAYLRRNLPEQS